MTRISVSTWVSLSIVGWVGAFLLVCAPLLGVAIALSQTDATIGQMAGTYGLTVCGMAIGLVLVMIGREYTHDVRILKPGEEA